VYPLTGSLRRLTDNHDTLQAARFIDHVRLMTAPPWPGGLLFEKLFCLFVVVSDQEIATMVTAPLHFCDIESRLSFRIVVS